MVKVIKGAKIRNRYNQVPHLTQDTNWKVILIHVFSLFSKVRASGGVVDGLYHTGSYPDPPILL